MARNTTVTAARGTMTELTNSDATNVTFQVVSGAGYIIGSASATAPAGISGGLFYKLGEKEVNRPLAELFPNLSAVRLFAYSDADAMQVSVHHA